MAPNRNDVNATLMSLDLSLHEIPTKPQYEPLTNAPELKSQHVFNHEASVNAVSCASIVENLIADSNRVTSTPASQSLHQSEEAKDERDSYWDMPSENDESQEDLFSITQVQRLLVEDAVNRIRTEHQAATIESATSSDPSHPRNSYWDWPCQSQSHEEQKAIIITAILKDERIRQILSTENITRNEQHKPVSSLAPQITHMHYSPDHSDDYWKWDAEEKKEVVANHVDDASHPYQSYWDFPSKPTTAKDVRQELIDQILKEEKIRQILSATTIQTSQDKNTNSTTTYVCASHTQDPSDPAHRYWDFPSTEEEKASLMEIEENERILSADHMVTKLIQHRDSSNLEVLSTPTSTEMKSEEKTDDQSCNYWDW